MILFLDFDGVVHPAHGELFTEVDRVARWLDGWPAVDVVVSSSWREVHPQSELVEMLGPVAPCVRLVVASPFHADHPRRSDPTCKRINIHQSS